MIGYLELRRHASNVVEGVSFDGLNVYFGFTGATTYRRDPATGVETYIEADSTIDESGMPLVPITVQWIERLKP
jgi:hypothetical protein